MAARWLSTLAAAIVAATPAHARPLPAEPPASESIAQARSLSKAFQSAAHRIEPSVVHVTQLNRVANFGTDFFGMPIRTGGSELRQTGLGSGVIVSDDGYILTNNHVAAADALAVRLVTGATYEARVIGRDPATDLAVIKIDAKGLVPARLGDSEKLEVGEWVLAIGSPLGFSNTVTAGIVSAKDRAAIGILDTEDFIQTDASINPGNSGGPLVNLDGEIVGINSAIATRTGGSEGIGFSIPTTIVKPVMDAIIRNGRVSRGWLGISMPDLRSTRPDEMGEGVPVVDVLEGGPADAAGLKAGDVILSMNGRSFEGTMAERVKRLRNAISLTAPGTTSNLEVRRGSRAEGIRVKLGDQSEGIASSVGGKASPALGIVVRTLTAQEARQNRLNRAKGAVVVEVERAGLGERADIQPGDIITALDGKPVTTAEELVDLAQAADFSNPVRANLLRRSPFGGGWQRGYTDIAEQ